MQCHLYFFFTFFSFKAEIINSFYISEQPKLNYEHPSLCDATSDLLPIVRLGVTVTSVFVNKPSVHDPTVFHLVYLYRSMAHFVL